MRRALQKFIAILLVVVLVGQILLNQGSTFMRADEISGAAEVLEEQAAEQAAQADARERAEAEARAAAEEEAKAQAEARAKAAMNQEENAADESTASEEQARSEDPAEDKAEGDTDSAETDRAATDKAAADTATDNTNTEPDASWHGSGFGVLNYEDEDILVTVEALEAGAFSEAVAALSVAPITRENPDTEDQYREVEEKLFEKAENEAYDIAGFLAYDIKLVDADGNKLEPAGSVKVSMSYKQEPVLSQDARETVANDENLNSTADLDVTVMHLEEDAEGKVTEVVDLSKVVPEGKTEEQAENKIEKIETDEKNAVAEMVFETGAFSVYTVTWTTLRVDRTVTFIAVDKDGNEVITGSGKKGLSLDDDFSVTNLASSLNVPGYTFQYAFAKNDGTAYGNKSQIANAIKNQGTLRITNVRRTAAAVGFKWQYKNNTNSWKDWNNNNNSTIYLYYEKTAPAPPTSDAIIWNNGTTYANHAIVHYVTVDADGNVTEIPNITQNVAAASVANEYTLANYAPTIPNYAYVNAYVSKDNNFTNGKQATKLLNNNISDTSNWKYYNGSWNNVYTSSGDAAGQPHVFLVYQKEDPITPGSSETGNLSHRKYIEKNTNGTYDLTLNVVGAVGTESHPANVDVVVVFDISTSMRNNKANGTEYYKHARNAVSALVDTVSDKDNVDARWNLITFGSRAQTPSGWYTDAAQFKTLVNSNTTYPPDSNGTNYEAALRSASNTLNSARNNATTVVIFLTDGVPTFHGTNTKGGGSYTQAADYTGAIDGAKTISSDKFYVVGINLASQNSNYRPNRQTAYYTGKDIADHLLQNSNAAAGEVIDAQATDLTKVFNDIAGEIINITVGDVTIYDQLTPEVQQVAGTGLTVKITDKNGNDVTATEQAAAKNGIVPSYDSTTRQLKLDFPEDYKLKQDYTYAVTINIQPSPAAEVKYIANGYKYNDVGELNTDAPNAAIKISEGVKGLYTNVENSARVTYYEYKGDTKAANATTGLYNKPIVKLDTEPNEPADVTKQPKHEKYIKKNADGTYDLTLNIAGKVGETVNPRNIDVILMLDATQSMDQSDKDGIKKMKSAANTLITSLEGKSNVNVKWSAGTFGQTYTRISDWTTTSSDVKTAINGITKLTTSGTNYCAAFDGISSFLDSANDTNEKIVVFLTDGEPNRYYDNNKNLLPTGSSYSYTNDVKTNTQTYASRITCSSFYSVVIGDAFSIFNNDINPRINASSKKVLSATTSDLTKVFEDISADITAVYSNKVEVHDTLSKYVDVPAGAVLQINVRDANGNVQTSANGTGTSASLVVTNPAGSKNKTGSQISAAYDPTTKELTMIFPPEYYLEPTYTYYIRIKNIVPSNEAYLYYQENSKRANTGDDKTDASADNWSAVSGSVSSNQPGFYSNDSAYVTYEFDGQKETLPYDKPVVDIAPETVKQQVIKLWGTGNTPQDITVVLSATAAGRTITKSICKQMPDDQDLTQVITASNDMKYPVSDTDASSWNRLPKYFYYRENGIAQKAEIQYTITENTLPGYNVDVLVTTDTTGAVRKDTTTITNTKIVEWKLVKDSTSDARVKLAGARFELTKTETVGSQTVTTTFYGESGVDNIDTEDEDELGLVSWEDANGMGISQTKIPAGTYTLKEVAAPGGYSCSAETWTVVIPYEGGAPTITRADGTVIQPLNNTEPYEYRYSDEVLYSLPSTGGTGVYWTTLMGVLLMIAAGMLTLRSKA